MYNLCKIVTAFNKSIRLCKNFKGTQAPVLNQLCSVSSSI